MRTPPRLTPLTASSLRQVAERDGTRALITGDYLYDAAGKVTRVADARGNARTYEYDGRSRRTHIADPNAGAWRLEYDDGDDLVRRMDPTGNVVSFVYDGIGRVLEERHQSKGENDTRAVVYHYDAPSEDHVELGGAAGRLAWVEDEAGAVFFGYDARGLETDRVRRWSDGTEHPTHTDYDAANRMIGRGFPDHSYLDIKYDARGSVRALGPVAPEIAWTASGQIEQIALGNGVTDTRHYDARQRLDRLEATTSAGASVRALHYVLDAASRITSVEDLRPSVKAEQSLSASYGFDDRDRLISATDAAASTQWTYDDTGNILSVASTNDEPSLNAENRFGENGAGPDTLTHHGDEALTYDAAGRLIKDGERTLHWDAKGRLARVERGEVGEEYVYGFDDMRAVKTTTRDGNKDVIRYIDDDVEERNGAIISDHQLRHRRFEHGTRRLLDTLWRTCLVRLSPYRHTQQDACATYASAPRSKILMIRHTIRERLRPRQNSTNTSAGARTSSESIAAR